MGAFLHLNEPDFAAGATVESANVAPGSARQFNVKALDDRIAKLLEKEFEQKPQAGQTATDAAVDH